MRWLTFLSLSLPSSACFRSTLTSSRYLRISLSASSRPSMARVSAASAALRSSCLPWVASVLNWEIFSCTELSRASLRRDEKMAELGRCWLTRSGVQSSSGRPPPAFDEFSIVEIADWLMAIPRVLIRLSGCYCILGSQACVEIRSMGNFHAVFSGEVCVADEVCC